MIAYFDTSALIPLLIEEPGSEHAARVWDEAEHVASVRLVYAEARAALSQAWRPGRLDQPQHEQLIVELNDLYEQLDRVEIDDRLVHRAGALAEQFGLRGYDAVHLAGAERFADEVALVVAGDHELCAAARTLGFAVADTSSAT